VIVAGAEVFERREPTPDALGSVNVPEEPDRA
jgi:hypothetical protein